jgi:hypothetical protein
LKNEQQSKTTITATTTVLNVIRMFLGSIPASRMFSPAGASDFFADSSTFSARTPAVNLTPVRYKGPKNDGFQLFVN